MEIKTQKEMNDVIQEHCFKMSGDCDSCPIERPCSHCYGHFSHPEHLNYCIEAYDILEDGKPTLDEVPEVPTVTHDPVNHPKHYCREGAMECIDEMVLIFGKEAVKHFCVLNAWKYRFRASEKNGEQDLRKSDWYINKFKELDNAN